MQAFTISLIGIALGFVVLNFVGPIVAVWDRLWAAPRRKRRAAS